MLVFMVYEPAELHPCSITCDQYFLKFEWSFQVYALVS